MIRTHHNLQRVKMAGSGSESHITICTYPRLEAWLESGEKLAREYLLYGHDALIKGTSNVVIFSLPSGSTHRVRVEADFDLRYGDHSRIPNKCFATMLTNCLRRTKRHFTFACCCPRVGSFCAFVWCLCKVGGGNEKREYVMSKASEVTKCWWWKSSSLYEYFMSLSYAIIPHHTFPSEPASPVVQPKFPFVYCIRTHFRYSHWKGSDDPEFHPHIIPISLERFTLKADIGKTRRM